MEFESLKKFIKLAKDEGVSSLKYEGEDFKASVEFGGGAVYPTYIPQNKSVERVSIDSKEQSSTDSAYYEITSPLVGTFYASSAPGEPSLVSVGDRISKGKTLCIVEAMKIMNEVESDVSGEIVEVCVENESLVEYGQVLFRIKT